jgi:hypothetical protein
MITSVPANVGYGQSFFVATPDAASVTKVTMLRLSATTHTFNMGQYFSQLTFSAAAGGVSVTPPANGNLAPPGYYLLFLVNGNGVPSVGSIVKLAAGTAPAGPVLTSLAPSSATAGGADFTLTVNGTNFVSGAVVQWNGASRPTSFVSATRLTAAIPATDIASQGTAQVTVANPDGSVSNAATFPINAPAAPTVTSLAPSSATAGGADFTLTVNGTNFVSGAAVQWNGTSRPTTFVSATRLTAAISAPDIATQGTAQVTVANPNGQISNAATFTINPAPSGFTLTVSKSGPGSVTSSPAGISCGVSCSAVYAPGSVVTLTATPNRNARFVGWSDACSGASTTCTLTMNAAKSVTARFASR